MQRTLAIARKLSLCLAFGLAATQVHAAGALAIDSNQGLQYGFAYDYPDLSQAQDRALSECGSNCEVVLNFENGCAAYAADQVNGSTAYGWGADFNAGNAQSRAISECQDRGGNACVVRSWGCNSE